MRNFTYIDSNGITKTTNSNIDTVIRQQSNYSVHEIELPESKLIHKATKYSTNDLDKIVVYLHDHLNKDKSSFIEIISYRTSDITVSYLHIYGKYLELRKETINYIKLIDESPSTLDYLIRSLIRTNNLKTRQ